MTRTKRDVLDVQIYCKYVYKQQKILLLCFLYIFLIPRAWLLPLYFLSDVAQVEDIKYLALVRMVRS